jgi:hypothetical protein
MSTEIRWREGVLDGNLGERCKRISEVFDEFFFGGQTRCLTLSEFRAWARRP